MNIINDTDDHQPRHRGISHDTRGLCLELLSGVSVPVVLPDGSANLHGPEKMRQLVSAHQELLSDS